MIKVAKTGRAAWSLLGFLTIDYKSIVRMTRIIVASICVSTCFILCSSNVIHAASSKPVNSTSDNESLQNLTQLFVSSQQSMLPFMPAEKSDELLRNRKVFAHRHMFPISYDNKPPANDRYTSEMMPGGSRSSRAGAFLRARPLARPVRSEKNWRVLDAIWDIRLAKAIGIDGFFFNLAQTDYDNPEFWPAFIDYLEAAEQVGDFTISPNIDLSAGEKIDGAVMADHLIDFLKESNKASSKALLHVDSRFVVSAFAANKVSVKWWEALKMRLIQRGKNPYIIICTLGWDVSNIAKYASVADAYGDWGIRDQPSFNYDSKENFGQIPSNKTAIAMIRAFDVRYKRNKPSFFESHGSKVLREHWLAAIKSETVDWAQLITWNDLGEDTSFMPNSAKQFAVYDLTAYFISWFKGGRPPRITRDAIYYFHRIMPANELPNGGFLKALPRFGSPRPVNRIEVIALLTSPGIIEIETNDGIFKTQAPAGFSVALAPLPESGIPKFRLFRGDSKIFEFSSSFRVGDSPLQDDLVYRSGGALRTIYGRAYPAASIAPTGASKAESCLGEPVWKVH